VVEETYCYVHAVHNFQIIIVNEGMRKCGSRCENVKPFQMGDYYLKTHMFTIKMGRCDVIIGTKWLRTLGLGTIDFKELYTRFVKYIHMHTLTGLQYSSIDIIISPYGEPLEERPLGYYFPIQCHPINGQSHVGNSP
jgi:hypothetical protein